MVRNTCIFVIWLALICGGCGGTTSEETTPEDEASARNADGSSDGEGDGDEVGSTDPDTTEEVIESSTPLP